MGGIEKVDAVWNAVGGWIDPGSGIAFFRILDGNTERIQIYVNCRVHPLHLKGVHPAVDTDF